MVSKLTKSYNSDQNTAWFLFLGKPYESNTISNFQLIEFFEEDSVFFLVFERMEGSLMEKLNKSTTAHHCCDYDKIDGFGDYDLIAWNL